MYHIHAHTTDRIEVIEAHASRQALANWQAATAATLAVASAIGTQEISTQASSS